MGRYAWLGRRRFARTCIHSEGATVELPPQCCDICKVRVSDRTASAGHENSRGSKVVTAEDRSPWVGKRYLIANVLW